ncbi:hypothetical protein HLI01_22125 [Rhizobium laguerreae]|uniref:BNR-4 repeat-containing protein n=1 Tax=Rhizobium laguerreae TaxID=1076926 RepID=UPI0014796B0F|nr:BNR-4 repeat-containing protein [Rhizobium laguerreae]NNH59435.1 hypothetical protein [Rhizobium laguerreae]
MSMSLSLSLAITNVGGGGGAPVVPGDDFFAELGSTSTWYANSTWPNGIYSSAMNKTLQAITDFTVVSSNSVKQVRLYGRDHAAGSWLSSVDLFVDDSNGTGTQPEADDHGVGALCEDHEGYLHAFGGVHNGAMKHVCSNAAGNVTAFTAQATIGTSYAYPHPVRVSSQINLFCRSFNGTLQYNLIVRRTSALSAGAATWGSELPVLSFGDNTRVYLGQSIAVGTDIFLVCTQADFGDTLRKHVYVLVYDTVTGNVRNLANTKTVLAASLPVGLSDADTFFRVVGFAGGEEGVTPSMCIENGRLHIGYIQGVDGAANVRHRYFDLATGAQQGGVNELGSTNNPRNTVTIAPGAVGIEARWTTNVGAVSEYQTPALPAVPYASGGDMWGASWTIGGGWAASAKIRAATRAHKVDSPSYVFNAHPDIRWMYAERASDTQYKLGGNLRSFAYGDSGIVKRDWGDDADVTTWHARRSTPLSSAELSDVKALVRALKGCTGWATTLGIYIGAKAPTLADAWQNLKANNYNQTSSGTIALDGINGPKGDGISGQSIIPYNPATAGGIFTPTDAIQWFWNMTEGQSTGYDIGCGVGIASWRCQARSATDTRNARAANSTVISASATSAIGQRGVRRTGNTGSFLIDGVGANTTALTVPAGEISPNGNLTFHTNGTAFASRAHALECFQAYRGSDLSGVEYNAFKRLLIAWGII